MGWILPGLNDVALDRALVKRGGLYAFVKLAWGVIIASRYTDGWHIREVCSHLEAVSRGIIRRLIINIPPGMSKSLTVSVMWPVWDWIPADMGGGGRADRRFMFASFDSDLSTRDALLAKELLQSEWFQARWGPAALGDDGRGISILETKGNNKRQETNTIYWNNLGGFRFSTSVGGKATGWHAHIQVVDDPTKPKDTEGGAAATRTALDGAYRWWANTMASRKADPSDFARVIMMQRIHDADLAGRMISAGGYELLRLPMRYEAKYPCKTRVGGDRRTEEGELLCPARYDLAAVKETEKDMGPAVAAAQLQQRPSPQGGQIFQRKWCVKRWRVLPAKIRLIQSWDFAFKDFSTSDYVVGQIWGEYEEDFYLVDEVRDRMNFPASVQALLDFRAKWPAARVILIEDKANGPAIEQTLRKKVNGIVMVEPKGSKESRAHAVSGYFEAGNVYLPEAHWVGDYVEEITTFPTNRYDDRVDTTSQALLRLTDKAGSGSFKRAMQRMRESR
jgi:predicted phage terminase large subunit-like protein